MTRSKWLLVALAFAAPAAADIYKCTDKSGLDRYQNFPCPIDSIGSSATAPSPAKTVPGSSGAPPAQPASIPVAVVANNRPAVPSEPRLGMSEDEVRAIWGEPQETIQDELRDGRIEIWRYGDGRSVQFSNKRRVLVVDR